MNVFISLEIGYKFLLTYDFSAKNTVRLSCDLRNNTASKRLKSCIISIRLGYLVIGEKFNKQQEFQCNFMLRYRYYFSCELFLSVAIHFIRQRKTVKIHHDKLTTVITFFPAFYRHL